MFIDIEKCFQTNCTQSPTRFLGAEQGCWLPGRQSALPPLPFSPLPLALPLPVCHSLVQCNILSALVWAYGTA